MADHYRDHKKRWPWQKSEQHCSKHFPEGGRAPKYRTKGCSCRNSQLEMAQALQKLVFALPGSRRMSVNTLLCDTLGLAEKGPLRSGVQEAAGRFSAASPFRLGFLTTLSLELIFGKGRRTATFQFSESGGSVNGPNLFTDSPFQYKSLEIPKP